MRPRRTPFPPPPRPPFGATRGSCWTPGGAALPPLPTTCARRARRRRSFAASSGRLAGPRRVLPPAPEPAAGVAPPAALTGACRWHRASQAGRETIMVSGFVLSTHKNRTARVAHSERIWKSSFVCLLGAKHLVFGAALNRRHLR